MPNKIGNNGERKKNHPTARQARMIKLMSQGLTQTEAARLVYSKKNPGQSGYQAMKQMRHSMPDVLEQAGLTNEALIDFYLLPAMNARHTKFFSYLKTVVTTKGKGKNQVKTEETKQVITSRTLAAWMARIHALDLAFRLKGSYAPKTLEEAQANPNRGVHVIVVDVPRPHRPQPIPAIDVPDNGDKPKD